MTAPTYEPVTPSHAAQNLDALAAALHDHDLGVPELHVECDYSDGTGMAPEVRAALMLTVKAGALDIAVAIRSRNAQQVQKLMGPMTRDELCALVIIFGPALDPAKLLQVVQTPDDGLPIHLTSEVSRAA